MNRSALVLIAAIVAALAINPAQAAFSPDAAVPSLKQPSPTLIIDYDTTRIVLVADNDDDDDDDGDKKKKRELKIKTRYFSE